MKLPATSWLESLPEFEPPPPKDSALGILLRRGDDGWEVLFGRRAKTSRFMPGHYAFPGGRMDADDRPGEDGAFARCAAREVEEEVGVTIPPAAWRDVGERVTPPIFPVRFRTRFFLAAWPEGAALPETPPIPEELDRIVFDSPARTLARWEENGRLLIAPPCLPILRELAAAANAPFDALADRLTAVNADEQRLPRIEFAPGVWVLPVRTRTLPPATHTNVWMPGGSRFVAIDPGSDRPAEVERLAGVLARRIADGARFEAALLTHAHPDHVAGVRAIAERFDVPVLAHELALERLDGLPGLDASAVHDGERIDLDGMALIVRHTPGHAPDHLAFEIEGTGQLISGDLHSGLSTILIHPPEGHMTTYLETLERTAAAGYERLFPAHGPPLPGGSLARVRAHRLRRESTVEAVLEEGEATLAQIAERVYADVPAMPAFLVEAQASGHLERLEELGRAERVSGAGSSALWRRVDPK